MRGYLRNMLVAATVFGTSAVLLLSHANLQIRKTASVTTASGTTQIQLNVQNRVTEHGFNLMKSGSVKHVDARPNSSWEWSFGVQLNTPDRTVI